MFVVVVIMQHKCDKDKCPADSRNGPKIKCGKCGNVTFLLCFGFQAGKKIDGQDTVIMALTNGVVFTAFVSCMAFHCCSDTMSAQEQKFVLKMPSARSVSKTRTTKQTESETMIANELRSIKEMLTSIKSATDTNTAEIAAIKSLSTTTDANVKKVTDQSASPSMTYVQAFKNRAIEKASRTPAGTPNSLKRQRTASPIRQKLNLPTAKMGTKSNVSGLSVVAKREPKRDEKPKFEKAIWVSRLSPNTTEDEVIEFITSNTPVTDKTKISVHKLVKKDADISSLKFVSFKVELNGNDFDVLNDPEVWPENIMVREFMQAPKTTFGDFFPRLDASNKSQSNVLEVERMQTQTVP